MIMSDENHFVESTEKVKTTKEAPCPDCYGGHFRPCNICCDTGVVTIATEDLKQN